MADDARGSGGGAADRGDEPSRAGDDGVDPFVHRTLVATVIGVSVVALALFLWYAVYVLMLIFAGILLAILLRALSDWVSEWTRLSHGWSLTIVLLALAVVLGGFGWLAAPSLIEETAKLSDQVPDALRSLRQKVESTPLGRMAMGDMSAGQPSGGEAGGSDGGSDGADATTPSSTRPATAPAEPTAPAAAAQRGDGRNGSEHEGAGGNGGQGQGEAGGSGIGGDTLLRHTTRFLTSAIDVFAALLVIFFTGLFIALDPRMYVRGLLRLLPLRHRVRGGEVIGAIGYTLKWWLVGQAIAMVIIGLSTWLGLLVIGVPLALVLGVLAGLFNFIPNFGPLISMIPAMLMAVTGGPEKVLYVLVLYLVLQNLEGNVLLPLIQRKAVDLPPALTISVQLLLGILIGGVGLALAVPIAAAAMVAVKMLYVEDTLGDVIKTPDDKPNLTEVREARREGTDLAEPDPSETSGENSDTESNAPSDA